MLNVYGPFLLVLMTNGVSGDSIAVVEMLNEASCRAAIVQLEPIRVPSRIYTYCIAAEARN